MMKEGGTGGAHTVTGLRFEQKTDLLTLLSQIDGYSVEPDPREAGQRLLFQGRLVARCFKKYRFYKFLREENVDWQQRVSSRLLPDDAILVIQSRTLFIVEVKFQKTPGSVDEKLQTCDFKRRQYMKLVDGLGLTVEYVYVLNDWFRDPGYGDVLEYIRSVDCHYVFGELPLTWLGLPTTAGDVGR